MTLLSGSNAVRRRSLRLIRHQYLRWRRVLAALLAAAAVLTGFRVLAPPAPPTISVSVESRELPSGTRLTSGDVEVRRMAAADVPDQVAHDVIGRVLAAPVTRGEALTLVRFVGPDLAEASTGDVVLPVRLPDAAMAALLRPGDVVDLFATDPGTGQARVVATNVDVLTAAAASSPSPTAGSRGPWPPQPRSRTGEGCRPGRPWR